jgi:ribonuclease/clavin/mitogillin
VARVGRGLVSSGRTLRALFLTHHHLDHVGGAAFFGEALGLPLWAHEDTAARLPELSIARTLREGEVLVLDGPRPHAWHVLHTPGHAPGHLCLWEPEARAVVVGDMVASVGTILIEPTDGDMTEYLRQLARLAALDAAVALPAHGAPIEAPTALFERYIGHRLLREAKVLEALRTHGERGAKVAELVPVAYADTPMFLWPIAALSLEAHLVKLAREGAVTQGGVGFRAAFSA